MDRLTFKSQSPLTNCSSPGLAARARPDNGELLDHSQACPDLACQTFQGQRGPSCMALTNRPLVLCSITTESVARVTSDPVAWDLGLLATPHRLLAWALLVQPSLAQLGCAGQQGRRRPCLGPGAEPACRESRLSQGLGRLLYQGPHIITSSHGPRQQCGCLWSSLTPSSHLLPQAFSTPHSTLPSAPGPAQAPSWIQSRSQPSLLSRHWASRAQSGLDMDPAFPSRIPP